MRNQILKHFSFLFALILISCGGGGGDDTGGGGGGGGPVDPPPTPPGKSTLVAPANNKTCETGTSDLLPSNPLKVIGSTVAPSRIAQLLNQSSFQSRLLSTTTHSMVVLA